MTEILYSASINRLMTGETEHLNRNKFKLAREFEAKRKRRVVVLTTIHNAKLICMDAYKEAHWQAQSAKNAVQSIWHANKMSQAEIKKRQDDLVERINIQCQTAKNIADLTYKVHKRDLSDTKEVLTKLNQRNCNSQMSSEPAEPQKRKQKDTKMAILYNEIKSVGIKEHQEEYILRGRKPAYDPIAEASALDLLLDGGTETRKVKKSWISMRKTEMVWKYRNKIDHIYTNRFTQQQEKNTTKRKQSLQTKYKTILRSATKISSIWRGYYCRLHLHVKTKKIMNTVMSTRSLHVVENDGFAKKIPPGNFLHSL